MLGFSIYNKLISTNGAVSLMWTRTPGLPVHAVLLADGEILDTFNELADANEFYTDAQNRMRDGLPWPDPDARADFEIHPLVLIKYAVSRSASTDKTDIELDGLDNFFNFEDAEADTPLLPCGCYKGACYCGQYPTAAQMREMQAEAEADLPERVPATLAEELEAEELRNFFGNPHLDN